MSCTGNCISAADIGVGSSSQIAYPDPTCPAHGDPHPFELGSADAAGRLHCRCGAYQSDHTDQMTTTLLGLEAMREAAFGYYDRARRLLDTAREAAIVTALRRAADTHDAPPDTNRDDNSKNDEEDR